MCQSYRNLCFCARHQQLNWNVRFYTALISHAQVWCKAKGGSQGGFYAIGPLQPLVFPSKLACKRKAGGLRYSTLCIHSNYLKFTLPVPLRILRYFWLKASICWLECTLVALHYNTNYPKLAALRLVIVVVLSLQ